MLRISQLSDYCYSSSTNPGLSSKIYENFLQTRILSELTKSRHQRLPSTDYIHFHHHLHYLIKSSKSSSSCSSKGLNYAVPCLRDIRLSLRQATKLPLNMPLLEAKPCLRSTAPDSSQSLSQIGPLSSLYPLVPANPIFTVGLNLF